ncbi:MAG TPA: TetR family transcriptional regulator [Rhizomicrobium sp.]|jgi:AcrR family transcriptional regulator
MESVARAERRAKEHSATRASILSAARKVAEREGAREFSLRGVAAEAGFAPAALYGYFRNKDEMLVALAADDLTALSHAMRDADGLAEAATAALDHLSKTETIAAASSALPMDSAIERLFNGRLITALKALSDASGSPVDSREQQADVVLTAASLVGLAVLARSGRLEALGFSTGELIARLSQTG